MTTKYSTISFVTVSEVKKKSLLKGIDFTRCTFLPFMKEPSKVTCHLQNKQTNKQKLTQQQTLILFDCLWEVQNTERFNFLFKIKLTD